mmetsp:Transcript_7528/g.11576  ORF Transcript_7528/g.11576 Transcript_7528/m.11576 type:complete len:266 (+) Transcript_7528:24-821(+)
MNVPTPAPKVEAATAEAVTPKASPLAEAPVESSVTNAETPANASYISAAPPPDASLTTDAEQDASEGIEMKYDDSSKPSVEALRATGKILFEGYAAVIIGPVQKNICEKALKCFYDERSFLSYGEVKRYIVIIKGSNTIFVYADADMPSPMYTIPLEDLELEKEDPQNPHFFSHTISPEAGEPFSNNKSKASLDTVLLIDGGGKIAYQLAFDNSEEGGGGGDKTLDAFIKAVSNAVVIIVKGKKSVETVLVSGEKAINMGSKSTN